MNNYKLDGQKLQTARPTEPLSAFVPQSATAPVSAALPVTAMVPAPPVMSAPLAVSGAAPNPNMLAKLTLGGQTIDLGEVKSVSIVNTNDFSLTLTM
ncbi:hypothetical protein FACS18949_03630 [Clostridia bacterium]|nr:hypothetical protein FACS18949_03630 [Clostridia bacterium]